MKKVPASDDSAVLQALLSYQEGVEYRVGRLGAIIPPGTPVTASAIINARLDEIERRILETEARLNWPDE